MIDEHRNSYRLQVLEELTGATLVVGKRKHEISLINESAAGYSVRIEKTLDIADGKEVKLHRNEEIRTCRVIHVRHEDGGTVVGLQLLAIRPPASPNRGGARGRQAGARSNAASAILIGAAIGFIVGALFLTQRGRRMIDTLIPPNEPAAEVQTAQEPNRSDAEAKVTDQDASSATLQTAADNVPS